MTILLFFIPRLSLTEESFLESIQFDHKSKVPLSDQAKQGMTYLSKHCLEFLLDAQSEHQALVDKAKEEHRASAEEERRQKVEKERLRAIEVS